MAGDLTFGAVISWKDWGFEDGGKSNKLLILLGAKDGKDMIAVLTTSNPPDRTLELGCNSAPGYYVIPAGKEGLSKETYVQLYRPQIVKSAELLKAKFSGDANVVLNLRKEIAAAIRNCLKQSKYFAPIQGELLE